MRLLLGTHAFIWHREGNDALGSTARKMMGNDSNRIFISIASIWEISIKTGLGKLKLSRPVQELLAIYCDAGAEILHITPEHATMTGTLPWHHRDPFDRMLVAQAMLENMAIVTRDEMFSPYGVACVW